jgi:hypothetical protein
MTAELLEALIREQVAAVGPTCSPLLTQQEAMDCDDVCRKVKGYSSHIHYAFFKGALALPTVRSILVLGVYHGRDIALMLSLARQHPEKVFCIVGVDKFTDDSCADWPPTAKDFNWRQAGFGDPPSLHFARLNTASGFVEIVAEDDSVYLANTNEKFDFIYLDTAHDEATVTRQIAQVKRLCHPHTLIAGDDYVARPFWGVIEAVAKAFREARNFHNVIWWTDPSQYRSTTTP